MPRLRRLCPHLGLSLLALLVALLVAAPSAQAIDPGTIVFQGKRNNEALIFTIGANGSGLKQWGPGAQPTISRDGKTIVFVKATDGGGADLWARNANGANLRRLTDDPGTDSSPSISANGQMVVFLGNRPDSDGVNIFSIDIDGTDERQLTHGEDNYSAPSISPDGSRIVFLGTLNGTAQVKAMDLDGGDVVQLTRPSEPFEEVERPSFSPDGKRVIFGAEVAKKNRIFICDAKDGGDRVQVTKGDDEGAEPAFSPNGSAIAFRRGPNIFTMNADGTGADRVTALDPNAPGVPFANLRPSWGQ